MSDVFNDWPDDRSTRESRKAFVERELKRVDRTNYDAALDEGFERRQRAGLAKANALCHAIDDYARETRKPWLNIVHDLMTGHLVYDVGDDPEARDD